MTEKIVIRDDIFGFIFEMALYDSTNRVSKQSEKKKLRECKGIIKNYAEAVLNRDTNNSFDSTVEMIQKRINGISFGKIQKLINMTMKYLYIRYYDDTKIKGVFDECDAPMDGIMREFVFDYYEYLFNEKPDFDRGQAWSTLFDKTGDYKGFQDAIKEIIKRENLGISPIEFDYRYWNFAKMLPSKRGERRSAINRLFDA